MVCASVSSCSHNTQHHADDGPEAEAAVQGWSVDLMEDVQVQSRVPRQPNQTFMLFCLLCESSVRELGRLQGGHSSHDTVTMETNAI